MKFKHLLYILGAASTAYFGTQKVTHLLNLDQNHKKDHQTYPTDFIYGLLNLYKGKVVLCEEEKKHDKYLSGRKVHETFVWQKPTDKKDTLTLTKIREEVEQIVSSEESNIIKIVQLKKIEEEYYKPLIQQLAYKKSQEELKDLVIVLKDLGYLTTKLGELSGELKYYTEAAIFYQYVITILEVDKKLKDESFIKQELTNSYHQLTNI